MPREKNQSAEDKSPRPLWRAYALPVAGVTAAGILALGVFLSFERWVETHPRFQARTRPLPGESGTLTIRGATRPSVVKTVRESFADDDGRSVYLLPLAERRARVLGAAWVRDATVTRRWPNSIDVAVIERTPIAFAKVSRHRGGALNIRMIDEDGALLPVTERRSYALPMLFGIREDQKPEQRRAAVFVMREFYRQIEGLGVPISELDVADLANVRCRARMDDRTVILQLGNANFGANVKRFRDHWPDIQRRMPGVTAVDLRLEDRITAAPDERWQSEEQ
jgi:cell division protein FtsQ